MFVLPNMGNYDNNRIQAAYQSRALGLAQTYGAALVDFGRLGRQSFSYWNGLGYWGNSSNPAVSGADGIHPSDAGHQFMADTLLPILVSA
jgi:lysophospholipase L1-like esterase